MKTKETSHLIDLTHTLTPAIAGYDPGPCFALQTKCDYKDCTPPNVFRVQKIECMACAGTHMDAPSHAIEGGQTIEALDLKDLITNYVVIFNNTEPDENFQFMPDSIIQFEKEHGTITPDTFVIFHSGWDRRWKTPEKYRNDLKFPSVHVDTAKLLMERNISGIGIDTLSADSGGVDFPVHRVILGAGKYLVENIANAKELPPAGEKIMIMPMKIEGGTEAPIRLVALVS